MKFLVLLLVVLTNFSCSTFFNRKPANIGANNKPRHVIITVHGLSGNALTWGDFGPITKNYLSAINPEFDVVVSNFVYPTGRNEKLSAFDFASALNAHIESLFRDRPLEPNDRISLVGHSQGGIVSYIWFFSRILNDKLEQKYIKQVDTIMTLGTPFWGSKLASILTDKSMVDIVPLINLLAETPVTRHELVDMAFGSDAVHNFRQLAIQMDTDPKLEQKIESLPVRFVNIVGVLPKNKKDVFANENVNSVSQFTRRLLGLIYQVFQDSSQGHDRVESDIAVMIPSARWNFIYSKPQVIMTGKNRIDENEFQHFHHLADRSRSKFLFTESVHLPFDSDNTLSMAYINKTCEQPETCNHPTYRYILEELANCSSKNISPVKCDETQKENIVQKMKLVNRGHKDKEGKIIYEQNSYKEISASLQTFSVQIEMKLKPGQIAKFPVKYFTGKTTEAEGMTVWQLNEPSLVGKIINLKRDKHQKSIVSTPEQEVYIGAETERRSLDIVSKEAKIGSENDIIRMNVVGYVKELNGGKTNKKTVVPMSINLPGLPSVDIEAVVQPGYSTYLALDYTQLQ